MSVDTRTPRTPTGGRSPGFDDEPGLSSVKVPCDPAQVIVNHASFRVQLAAPAARGALADAAHIPALRGPAAAGARRRAPVVWSGRTEPGGTAGATTQLLHAVRNAGIGLDGGQGEDVGTTQVLPRVRLGDGAPGTTVIGQRGPADSDRTPLLRGVRPVGSAYGDTYQDHPYPSPYGDRGHTDDGYDDGWDDDRFQAPDGYDPGAKRRGTDSVRHAYYPGRRMNLGVVLLPLRIFLGLISVYAGMGKLCDPVYFDGGERGSMVKWLLSLDPWALAVPLRDFAVSHPVGAGLTVAFLQVVVGVLTICGLWQRVAASIGALLSAVLLMTVSWRTLPAYDAPDIIYLAAWSPLIIAGAPVYSMDGRLAGRGLAASRAPRRGRRPAAPGAAPRCRDDRRGGRTDPADRFTARRRRTLRDGRDRPAARRARHQQPPRLPAAPPRQAHRQARPAPQGQRRTAPRNPLGKRLAQGP